MRNRCKKEINRKKKKRRINKWETERRKRKLL